MNSQISIQELKALLEKGDDRIFIPIVVVPDVEGPVEPPKPPTPTNWDPRLTVRGATLELANPAPGSDYWKLVKAVWMDENESGGRHHIFVELLDKAGRRVVGEKIRVSWGNAFVDMKTEAKLGEPWAANFGMYAQAPAYNAAPVGLSDKVDGMGLGSIEQPRYNIHTSYGLTWQWTEA